MVCVNLNFCRTLLYKHDALNLVDFSVCDSIQIIHKSWRIFEYFHVIITVESFNLSDLKVQNLKAYIVQKCLVMSF